MLSTKIKYFLYGALVSISLITIVTEAATYPNGIFGKYFENITTACTGSDDVITGFDSTAGIGYGTRICKSVKDILGSIFGGVTAPANNAVIGFNADGSIKFGPMTDTIWLKNGGNISYTGGNVGIGIDTPVAKLDINGKAISFNTSVLDDSKTLTTKSYLDTGLAGLCTSMGGTWIFPSGPCNPAVFYVWQVGAYGSCSTTCDPGIQVAPVTCIKNTGLPVADSFCAGAKPVVSQSCNLGACFPTNKTFTLNYVNGGSNNGDNKFTLTSLSTDAAGNLYVDSAKWEECCSYNSQSYSHVYVCSKASLMAGTCTTGQILITPPGMGSDDYLQVTHAAISGNTLTFQATIRVAWSNQWWYINTNIVGM